MANSAYRPAGYTPPTSGQESMLVGVSLTPANFPDLGTLGAVMLRKCSEAPPMTSTVVLPDDMYLSRDEALELQEKLIEAGLENATVAINVETKFALSLSLEALEADPSILDVLREATLLSFNNTVDVVSTHDGLMLPVVFAHYIIYKMYGRVML
jgi:hypothetical protein